MSDSASLSRSASLPSTAATDMSGSGSLTPLGHPLLQPLARKTGHGALPHLYASSLSRGAAGRAAPEGTVSRRIRPRRAMCVQRRRGYCPWAATRPRKRGWRRGESNPCPQPHRSSVYKLVQRFSFARKPARWRPTAGLALLSGRAAGEWLSLGAEPVS